MRAVFKADGAETQDRYSASEWTVAPHSTGPGPHSHAENDELFLITEGRMSVLIGDEWIDAERGTFLRIPAGVTHDFENRTDQPATLFNVFIPGGFEHMMPRIVDWFSRQSRDAAQKKDAPGNAAPTDGATDGALPEAGKL